MAVEGNYIVEDDVDNWDDLATDAQKQEVIDRMEYFIEELTGDYYYPRKFDLYFDGNGRNRLPLGLKPDILDISSYELYGVTISASSYKWDRQSIYLDLTSASGLDVEIRYLIRESKDHVLFPWGENNVRIQGTYGWPEKLIIDNVSGTFVPEETITGGSSGATAEIKEVQDLYLLIVGRSVTDFSNNEEITGGTSEATADINNTNGAEVFVPTPVKRALVILCRDDNDPTIYQHYIEGSEGLVGYQYDNKEKVLTGVYEADLYLRPFVLKSKALMRSV